MTRDPLDLLSYCGKTCQYQVGDRVFIYMPTEQQGKLRKLARPFFGPYRIEAVTPSTIRAVPVDRPGTEPIFVNLNRVRPC